MHNTADNESEFLAKTKKIKTKQNSASGTIFATLLLLIVIAAAGGVVFLTIFINDISKTLPSADDILNHEPSLATIIYDRNGKQITQLFKENRTWVKIGDVSPWMVKAILAAEDDKFYDHHGIRPLAILRAGVVDFLSKGAKQGASTITQQLARNLFLSHEKTIIRKAKEAILALRLEKIYSKEELLEMYLNTIYMGHGAYGVVAASKIYFNKAPAALDINESASLAGLVAAPEKYSPLKHQENFQKRKSYVMRRMLDLDWISKDDYDENINKKPVLSKRTKETKAILFETAPYFISHILFKSLLPNYGTDKIYSGGLKIYTTLDSDLQKKAEELASSMKNECAIVAIDPTTGEVLALVGGRNFAKSKFNRATQAFRQPGSSFKPIVYTAALEQGYRAIDHILDAPLNFENGWKPGNYERGYSGEVTVVSAVARSLNTPAVRTAQIDGISNIIDVARRLGLTTEHLPDDLSIALGTASVTPLEMSVVYSAFANNGYRVEPYFIKEIRSRKNEILEQNGPNYQDAISRTTAVCMRSILQQTTSWGTGSKAAFKNIESFGKTGTTDDCTDAWFAGGVPGLVTVVYVGNDNHKSLGARATGAQTALPIWKKFMDYAVTKSNITATFTVAPDAEVEAVTVCRQTGFLACDGCKRATLMLPAGHAPSSKCPWHGGSRELAAEDENAPQLILAPIDNNLATEQYAMALPQQAVEETISTDDSTSANHAQKLDIVPPAMPQPMIHQKKTEEKHQAKLPNAVSKPYQDSKKQEDDFEARYQNMLRKYKIIE